QENSTYFHQSSITRSDTTLTRRVSQFNSPKTRFFVTFHSLRRILDMARFAHDIRFALARQIANLHHHRGLVAGPGDGREYGHLHFDRPAASAPLAREESRTTGPALGA